MRFIDRSEMQPPKILFSKQADAARQAAQDFVEASLSKGGKRRAPSTEWLDGSFEFRSEMADLFHKCCAYCESPARFDGNEGVGLVGRHRPPALAEDERGHTELTAYTWLACEWENLLWLCRDCARAKGNLFFVGNRRGETFAHVDILREIEDEQLMDPCFHDPWEHLRFVADGDVAAVSELGQATIDLLQLDRPELKRRRKQAIANYGQQLNELSLAPDGPERVVRALERSGKTASHAGAAKSAFMTLASNLGVAFSGWDDFADRLGEVDHERLRPILRYFLEATDQTSDDALGTVAKLYDAPRKVRELRPSRIPKLKALPLARKPISRVEIRNFKALNCISFDLPLSSDSRQAAPCMLLLGENATGKSSVLEAMALGIIGASEAQALDKMMPHDDFSPAGLIHRPDFYDWQVTADDLAIALEFSEDESIELMAKAGDAHFSGSDTCAKIVMAYGPRRFFASGKKRRLRAPAHRVRSLFDPMDTIANPIEWLSDLEEDAFFAAARALREILMLAEEDEIERDEDEATPGQIYVTRNGQRIAMKDLSVGYKSVIAMACDIMREMLYHYDNLEYASAVVFIDEIETHLHPRWKMRIVHLLREAFPQIQFIITTHDPLCLRGMHDGEVFVLHRDEGTDQVMQVADLPSLEGMRAEQILTSEFFGLGSTDPQTDARLVQYNRLAARIEDLTDEERADMDRLSKRLDDMVLGSSLREQAYAEALKQQVATRLVVPTKVDSPRRAALRDTFSSLFAKGDDT